MSGGRPSAAAPYLGLFRMRLIRGLSYRAAAAAGAATQFFWGFMLISVLQAFAKAGGSPMPDSSIASYIWLQQAFLVLAVIWIRDAELVQTICSGNAAYELCRPVGLYGFWFSRVLGGRLAAAALRALPILAVAALLPPPWRLLPPASAAAALAFLAALALGTVMTVALSMFGYALTLRSLHPHLGFLFLAPLVEFFSGLLIPLPFLPGPLRALAEALPFRYSADLPFRLWSLSIPASAAPALLLAEAAWTAPLLLLGRLSLRAALRAHEAPGG